jgi:hypothetical protein
MVQLWALIKLIPKLGGLIMTSKTVLEAIKKDINDRSPEAIGMRELELRIEKLEAGLAGVDKTLRRSVTAIYLVAGVAVAALLLAIIKLA